MCYFCNIRDILLRGWIAAWIMDRDTQAAASSLPTPKDPSFWLCGGGGGVCVVTSLPRAPLLPDARLLVASIVLHRHWG